MSRPLSAPPFPQNPQTWLAYFRHRAELISDRSCSPEVIGEKLGVSGATVRRWEKGTAVPTDDDLVRFSSLCGLSEHQRAFLLIAFRGASSRFQADPENFRANTTELLSCKPAPTLLMDELMYIRAWNTYMPVLGERAAVLLDQDRHPLECFLDQGPPADAETARSLRKAVRSFWRFSAHCSNAPEYSALVCRLHAYPAFSDLWSDLGEGNDSTPIDVFGVAELLLPRYNPAFTVTHSVSIYPPVFSVFQFQPADDEAAVLLSRARSGGPPRVAFNPPVR